MKRTLTALSLAVLAGTAIAGTEVITNLELDRTLTTYPEIADSYRQDAGQSDTDNVVKDYIADAYRQEAGESDGDDVVKNNFA
jgi:uncharacterized protein YxeA